jgi:hypothetical protein
MLITITTTTNGFKINLNDLSAPAGFSKTSISIKDIIQMSLSSDDVYLSIWLVDGRTYSICALPIWLTLTAEQKAVYYPIEKLNAVDTTTNPTLYSDLEAIIFA